jgi:ribosomal protein S18 acetylase RimI-like enzyme
VKIEIRRTYDADSVADLAGKIWNECYPSIITQEQIGYMVEKFQSAPAIENDMEGGLEYYLISDHGECAGYLAVLAEEDGVFLSKLYILDRFRGTGAADAAMLFLLKYSEGKKRIRLTVNKGNRRAIAFYEKKGFAAAGRQKKDIGGGFFMDDHVMELRL